MTRTFREQIGVTPKTLARLVRFRREYRAALRFPDSVNLAEHAS